MDHRLKGLALACLALCVVFPAHARITPYRQYLMQVGRHAPTTSYVGPVDAATEVATNCYALRAASAAAAIATKKAIRVRRASDNATLDIGVLKTGALDISSLTTFLTATTGFVNIWYDQCPGADNVVQNTAGNQPPLTLSALGSFPAVCPNANTITMIGVSNVTPATGKVSVSVVANRASGTGSGIWIRQAGASGSGLTPASSANNVIGRGAASGTITTTASDAAWHAISAVVNGASPASNVDVDGTTTTGTMNGNTTAGTPRAMTGGTTTTLCAMELLVFDNVAFSGAEQTAINSNQHTYWGF